MRLYVSDYVGQLAISPKIHQLPSATIRLSLQQFALNDATRDKILHATLMPSLHLETCTKHRPHFLRWIWNNFTAPRFPQIFLWWAVLCPNCGPTILSLDCILNIKILSGHPLMFTGWCFLWRACRCVSHTRSGFRLHTCVP